MVHTGLLINARIAIYIFTEKIRISVGRNGVDVKCIAQRKY